MDPDDEPGRVCPCPPATEPYYELRLFVAGASPRSRRAVRTITTLCEAHLQGRYALEVVDIHQHPELLNAERVVATPTLIRMPPPRRLVIIGDLFDPARVLRHLGIRDHEDVTDLSEHAQTNARLQAALSEKEVLLKEIHHRVKNNLQVIASLLRMQSRTVPDGPWREQLRESQHRIRAMALVHEQLYAAPDMARINAAAYLHALASSIVRAYAVSPDRILLFAIADEHLSLSIDMAVPIGLIVTELVTNSVKYAFPDGQSGRIQISLQVTPRALSLTVSDNGVGLPEPIDLALTPSLGLRIVRSLSQQLGGSVSLERGGGTTFRMTMPQGPTVGSL